MAAQRLVIPAFFLALGLGGCSDRALDTGLMGSLTGEPSPVSDNPSPIRGLSGENTSYPNLASVPPRPTGLTTEEQRQTKMDGLAKDRSKAKKTQADALARPSPATLPANKLPKPAAVPAKPTLTPGKPAAETP